MDKILETMDKTLTKVQKKVEKKITYVNDWLEAKLS